MGRRKSPEEIVDAIMETLTSEPMTTDEVAKSIGSSWTTAWIYLNLIHDIQEHPRVIRQRAGYRRETWKKEEERTPS